MFKIFISFSMLYIIPWNCYNTKKETAVWQRAKRRGKNFVRERMLVPMGKLLAFGVQAQELAKIKRAAGGLKLHVSPVPVFLYRQSIGRLSEGKIESLAETVQMGGEEEIYQGGPPKESMLLICGLSDAQLDKLLAALKKNAVQVDYKAVLTAANAKWNVLRLYAELALEKRAYQA